MGPEVPDVTPVKTTGSYGSDVIITPTVSSPQTPLGRTMFNGRRTAIPNGLNITDLTV